jgi:thiamine biosynthesis lipoprotein
VKKATVAIAILLTLAVSAQTAPENSFRPGKQLRYLMGTIVEIKAYQVGQTPALAEKTEEAINAAFAEIKRLDAMLSNWRADSELMRLNREANQPGAAVAVSRELFARVQIALGIAKDTGGGFDPTVGPLVRAWGFLPMPSGRHESPAQARHRVGWERVSLETATQRVRFGVSNMEIDLGGIAKGYAAQRAVKVLSEHGIRDAIVNLGGSSITALGRPYVGDKENCGGGTISSFHCEGWGIYIRDPRGGPTPVAAVSLRQSEALATSGTYENVTSDKRGKRSHIINPHTGQAVGGKVSVTVLAPDAETADALTKPFFFVPSLDSPEAQKILRNYPKASVMLIARRGDSLRIETAGAEPARFVSLLSSTRTAGGHVAKTR